jgi:hypothetical protein
MRAVRRGSRAIRCRGRVGGAMWLGGRWGHRPVGGVDGESGSVAVRRWVGDDRLANSVRVSHTERTSLLAWGGRPARPGSRPGGAVSRPPLWASEWLFPPDRSPVRWPEWWASEIARCAEHAHYVVPDADRIVLVEPRDQTGLPAAVDRGFPVTTGTVALTSRVTCRGRDRGGESGSPHCARPGDGGRLW